VVEKQAARDAEIEQKIRQDTAKQANFINKQKEKIAELTEHNKELQEEARHL